MQYINKIYCNAIYKQNDNLSIEIYERLNKNIITMNIKNK